MLASLSGSDSHGLGRHRAWQESSGVVASYPIVSEFGAQNMLPKMPPMWWYDFVKQYEAGEWRRNPQADGNAEEGWR